MTASELTNAQAGLSKAQQILKDQHSRILHGATNIGRQMALLELAKFVAQLPETHEVLRILGEMGRINKECMREHSQWI